MPFPTLGSLGISLLPFLVPEKCLSAEKAGNKDQQSATGLLSIVEGLCAWQLPGILERLFAEGDLWAEGSLQEHPWACGCLLCPSSCPLRSDKEATVGRKPKTHPGAFLITPHARQCADGNQESRQCQQAVQQLSRGRRGQGSQLQALPSPCLRFPKLLPVHTAAAAAKSLQLRPTPCDPIDGSPPDSPVPGILQARTLEWVAISFSNA